VLAGAAIKRVSRQALLAIGIVVSQAAHAISAGDLVASYCTSKLVDRDKIKRELVAQGDAAARALVDVLRGDRHECWEQSTDVLIAIGPAAAAVMPDLVAMLRSARAAERVASPGTANSAAYMRGVYAAGAASAIRPSDPALVAEIVDMVERGSPSSKVIGARMMAARKTADAAASIARLLDDPSPMVQQEAAGALGSMGPAADAAVPALVAAAERDRANYLATASMIALRNIGTPQARDAMRRLDASK
jgi:HEAT repeat protein